MKEIVFEVTQESDGGYVAECLTESIITQADNWEELRKNVTQAVAAFYFDRPERPSSIRLHPVRDEIPASA
jgi:predicted RNase H-like HicB family nuclease